MHILRRKAIFTLIFSQLKCVLAYDYNTGSFVTGDLSIKAPWSLPADAFTHDTKSPDFFASFNITGYNISADTPSPQDSSGWVIIAPATTLYIQAPDAMILDPSWRICAVVYPGVDGLVPKGTTVDGSCNGILNDGCLQALKVAETSGTNGMDNDGVCASFVLPERCKGSIPEPLGDVTAFGINQPVFDEQRFYAFGSMPVDRGNITAHDEARQNVWPVIMVYGHLSSTGQLTSKNAGLQCVRAVNGTTDEDLSGAARFRGWSPARTALGAVIILTWTLSR